MPFGGLFESNHKEILVEQGNVRKAVQIIKRFWSNGETFERPFGIVQFVPFSIDNVA